jgi:arsenate reductase
METNNAESIRRPAGAGSERGRVLFLHTGNSARSQMAEGFLRAQAGEHFEVFSAGTAPRSEVHPLAVRVMAEAGVDIAAQAPKHLSQYVGQDFAFVITVCDRAREACPTFPGDPIQIHWSFDDPAAAVGTEEERHRVFRRVRDEIHNRIRLFVNAQVKAGV